jgi:DNA-binding transcriptional LysR family regulator
MLEFTLQQLACFEAVAENGTFQAAARQLGRTHPAVYAAIKAMETQFDTRLLERKGYRVTLTPAGAALREKAKAVLAVAGALRIFAQQLAMGEESDLRIVIGDLCPIDEVVKRLHRFAKAHPNTRLHLHFEALTGPWERLHDEQADLILHHVDKSDARLEWQDLLSVTLIPVVAPGFLKMPVTDKLTPSQMKPYVQCIIRDSARSPQRDYFVIEGGQRWTVSDQLMKKQLIVLGMGWGHMPLHLIDVELAKNKLISIEGKHFKRSKIELCAARLRKRPAGPVAERLWRLLAT